MQVLSQKGLDGLAVKVQKDFEAYFQRSPDWVVSAPGRVNLIGEHTDYNDGFVLPMAIERNTVLAAKHRESADERVANINIFSESLGESKTIQIVDNKIQRSHNWTDYIAGIFAGFLERGVRFQSLDIAVGSSVPMGGGLSSSAALEVSTATLLEVISNTRLDPLEKVLLCQKAEHEYAGVPCGIMDQFASVHGQKDHLMLLDCQSSTVEMIPFDTPDFSILVIDSNVKHQLANGEYGKRRAECEAAAAALKVNSLREVNMNMLSEHEYRLDPLVFKRARHVVTEIIRTQQAADAMKAGDWRTVGNLMLSSHASLRDDYEVSCDELDLLVEIVMDRGRPLGVLGSRMTGGGFGGCTVSLVPNTVVEFLSNAVSERYFEKTKIEPSIFTARPAMGAHVIRK